MLNIGVLRLSSLGDTVLVTPILRALKRRFPESHLSLMVKKEYGPVFLNNPHVDRRIELDAQGPHKGLLGLHRFITQNKTQEYDLFLDLHDTLRSRLITMAVRARRKKRYGKRHWQRWAMVHLKWLPVASRHAVDLYFDPLKSLGIESADRRPEIFLTSGEIRQARELLEKAGLHDNGRIVGIHVGAWSQTKRWLPEYFSTVMTSLSKGGCQFVLFGTEEDESFLQAVGNGLAHRPVAFSQLPLRQLMALIDRCDVLLCHDSGPMHLAVARKVPVVALFGPTHPNLGFWPLGDGDIIKRADAECSPCSLHGTKPCRRERKVCMEEILPEGVTTAILQALERKKEFVDVGAEGSPVLRN
jgi:heptosyltransferase-2